MNKREKSKSFPSFVLLYIMIMDGLASEAGCDCSPLSHRVLDKAVYQDLDRSVMTGCVRCVSRTTARSWSTGAWTTSTSSPAASTLTTGPSGTYPSSPARQDRTLQQPSSLTCSLLLRMRAWRTSVVECVPATSELSGTCLRILTTPRQPRWSLSSPACSW